MPKITDPELLAELEAPLTVTRGRVFGAPDPYKVRDQQRQDEAAARAERAANRADSQFSQTMANAAEDRAIKREQVAEARRLKLMGDPLSAKDRGALEADYKTLDFLDRNIAALSDQYERNFKGKGLGSLAEYAPGIVRPANSVFNDTSNQLPAFIASALNLSGQQFNTPAEQKLFVGSFLPAASDTDEQITQKLQALRDLAKQGRIAGAKKLGVAFGADQAIPSALTPTDRPQSSPKIGATFNGGGGGGNIATGATADVPIPPEMQAEYDQFVSSNRGRITPEAYAQFRIEQNQKYGFGLNPGDVEKYISEGRRINDPTNNINTNIPSPKAELGNGQSLLGNAVSTAPGAAFATYLNSAALGIPGALAGNEKINAIQDTSPVGSFLGNVAGVLTGTAGIAKGALNLGAKSLPNALTGANLAYGGALGASSNTDNPLLGAATGLGVAVAGQGAGQFILGPALGRLATSSTGNRVRGLFGRRALPKAPTLSRAESSISDAIGTDQQGIAQFLRDAERLGVPATLADANPGLRSLAGAAARRSTEAKAVAESILEPRQTSQIDRLQYALNRDLGPGTNIPQMSEDLLRQARNDSRSLYEQAYAAPGASSVDASGVLSTPTGKEALKKAYRAVLDDQGDPLAMGFDLDEAGEVVLTKTPSFQALDYVKRSFDDIAQSGERNPITGAPIGNQSQTSAANAARELRTAIDAVNPYYQSARAAYAGPVGEREALAQGARFGRMTPDEMSFAFRNLSPARQDQFRLGARSEISNQADRVRLSSNPFDSILGTPAAQQKISTLFPERSDYLIRQAELEKALAQSKNQIIGNSMTAERQLADQAFALSPGTAAAIDGAAAIGTGAPPVLTAARLLGGLSKESLKMGVGKKKANDIAAILFDYEAPMRAAKAIELKGRQKRILGGKARRRNRASGSIAGAALTTPFLAGE